MKQLIAVLVALVLSACSYDPYHYYYSCTKTDKEYDFINETYHQQTLNVPRIYVHNNILEVSKNEIKFTREDNQYWWYEGEYPNPSFRIEKGTNRINDWNCTVVKTLFKK